MRVALHALYNIQALERELLKVDGFRFIGSLHTTARQLGVCSELVNMLNGRQLPKSLLSELVTRWSAEEENSNEIYSLSKGKLTEKGKPTTSFSHYLNLAESLGLLLTMNNFVSNKRLANLLIYFRKKSLNTPTHNDFANGEQLFYLSQLLHLDADGIMLVLGLLFNSRPKNQNLLQEEFKEALNQRLLIKQDAANSHIKSVVAEKYRTVNYTWQNAKKYSEHIVIPRCEWLSSLGLLEIRKSGSSTNYSLTNAGIIFYQNIPLVDAINTIRDVNTDWLFTRTFSAISLAFYGGKNLAFSKQHEVKRKEYLGLALSASSGVVKSSTTFKLPLYDTLLFISIYLCLKGVCINFRDICEEMENGFIFDNKRYLLKTAGRINEGYITISLL